LPVALAHLDQLHCRAHRRFLGKEVVSRWPLVD
jgi:hypothetical protein